MHFRLEGVVVVVSIIAEVTHLEKIGIKEALLCRLLGGSTRVVRNFNLVVKTSQVGYSQTILLLSTATSEKAIHPPLAIIKLYPQGHTVLDSLHNKILKGWLAQIVISSEVAIREHVSAFVTHVPQLKIEMGSK